MNSTFGARIVQYGLMAGLGIAHAQTFSRWHSGGLAIVLLALAWSVVALSTNRPTRLMFVFAWADFGAGLYWLYFSMHGIGGLPVALSIAAIALLAAYLSLYPALAAWAWRRWWQVQSPTELKNYVLALPLLWLLSELVRGYVFGGFPWLMSGYAQIDNLLFKGWFAVFGVYGVGALTMLMSGLLAWGIVVVWQRRWSPYTAAWVVFIGLSTIVLGLITNGISWGTAIGAPVTVRVVQSNVAQSIKFDADTIRTTTVSAFQTIIDSNAPLTVLPETVLPYPWSDLPERLLLPLRNSLQQSSTPRAVLMGGVGVEGAKYFNSGIWLDARSDVFAPLRYDKIHLLPFGETIPWGFQWLINAMHIPLGGYAVGQSRTPFALRTADVTIKVGVNICYENVFGEELTDWHRDDAAAPNIWVNLTNLGWFGDARTSPASVQFLQMSRARAMELARPMLTVTNTGISASIAPDGAVMARLPAQTTTVGDWTVQAQQGRTPFVRWGNCPLWLLVAGFGLATWLARRIRRVKT